MKRLIVALPLLLIAVLYAGAAQADVRTLDPVDNPLGDCSQANTPDECMGSGTVTVTCTNSYGCPQCALDASQSNSICYVIQGNYGYCKCSGQSGFTFDKYGQKMANCNRSGYCTTR